MGLIQYDAAELEVVSSDWLSSDELSTMIPLVSVAPWSVSKKVTFMDTLTGPLCRTPLSLPAVMSRSLIRQRYLQA